MGSFHDQSSVLVGSSKFYFNYPKCLIMIQIKILKLLFSSQNIKNAGLLSIVGTKSLIRTIYSIALLLSNYCMCSHQEDVLIAVLLEEQ